MSHTHLHKQSMKKNSISDIHDYVRQARRILDTPIPNDVAGREHVTGKYKEYTRMPAVALPVVTSLATLHEAFDKRTSEPVQASSAITLEDVSLLLSSFRVQEDGGRSYPSGGAKYPIEIYIVGTINEYTRGVFHYHPQRHSLEHLWPLGSMYSVNEIFGSTVKEQTALAIIFTALWRRTSQKYGDFGYQLALLEAGHMAQNILLSAAARGIGARPFAGYNDEMITEVLDLDPGQEQPVYSIQIFA